MATRDDQLREVNTVLSSETDTRHKINSHIETLNAQIAQANKDLARVDTNIKILLERKSKLQVSNAALPTLDSTGFKAVVFNPRAGLPRSNSTSSASSPADVKSAWREFKTDEGKSYFYNKITKQTTWKNPLLADGTNPPAASSSSSPAPAPTSNGAGSFSGFSSPPGSGIGIPGAGAARALPKSTSSFARAEPSKFLSSGVKSSPAVASPRTGAAPPQISKDAQIKGLQEKIEEIKGEIKKKIDTKKGLEKLAGFYNTNIDAVTKAKTEAEALGHAITSLKNIRDKYQSELEDLCPELKKEVAPKPSVSPWKEIKGDQGTYYFNLITKETTWEKPEGFDAAAPVTVPTFGAASVKKAAPVVAPKELTPEERKKQLETQLEDTKQKLKDLINKKKGVEKLMGFYSGNTGAGAQAQDTVKNEVAALQKTIDELKAKKHSLMDTLEKDFPGSVQKKDEKPKVNPWKKIESAEGAYYYNLLTKETTWENPNPEEEQQQPQQHQQPQQRQQQQQQQPPPPEPEVVLQQTQYHQMSDAPLPAGWAEQQDDDGSVYYYNNLTGESVWERPGDAVEVPPAPVEMRVEALYDYTAENDQELGFYAGEYITITKNDDGEWWYGHIGDRHGYLPKNFVRVL